MLRAEQEDQEIIHNDVGSHQAYYHGNILQPQLRHPDQQEGRGGQGNQQGRLEGGHGGQAPGDQAHELCRAGEAVDGRGAFDVIEQIGHISAPPGHGR